MKKFTLSLFIILFQRVFGQIPNPDFEDWYPTDSVDMPVGWSVTGEFPGIPYSIYPPKDTDSYTGEYCIRLWYGSQTHITAKSGFDINYHPILLHGFFKATTITYDSITVIVKLYYLNQVVDSGIWFHAMNVVSNYMPFTVDISQNSSLADSSSITMVFVKNNPTTYWNDAKIDHLYFDDNSGISSLLQNHAIQISPNPCASEIAISNFPSDINQFQLTIINELSQHYERGILKSSELSSINISDLPQGMYEMVLRNEHKKWVGKFIKQ